ncbi:MAG: class I SAM-dependent methyltransferase [Rhodospirillaceae bacterium]|nr:class I SAM-dependent methyltransferase [Rhodospirillaceae bacterium]
MTGKLHQQRQTWDEKPVLRAIYGDYYRRIVAACRPGRTLEVGGGSGNLKALLPDVVSSDIVVLPWLDVAADAQALPFAPAVFANIVAVDVLHHIERPVRFLREAERLLQPGGRLVLLEPAITPLSHPFYHRFHPEPVDMAADPLADGPLSPDRDPFDANQAVASLLVRRHAAALAEAVPGLRLSQARYLSLLAYPLSGGFRPWSLIPAALVPAALWVERGLEPVLGRLMGFRLLLVLDRAG